MTSFLPEAINKKPTFVLMTDTADLLLITPPFTQLNTPYPATAYLKGYIQRQDIVCKQVDLGIEVILKVFSKEGLSRLFREIEMQANDLDDNCRRMLKLKSFYLSCIDPTIRFLQNKNPTLAYTIAEREYLPEANRFEQLEDMEWAFGHLGVQDKARHLATLFLEDISDLIKSTIDPFFGFSRYAERISLSAESFDGLYQALSKAPSFIDGFTTELLDGKIKKIKPKLIGFSIPFPGNLYSALRCGQYIKAKHPEIKVSLGGGYPNTELRTVSDTRLFEFIDYITLDDGEKPLELLIKHLKDASSPLKRTLTISSRQVIHHNSSKEKDVSFNETGTPDYTGLPLDQYLSVIELTNPMHRLWSDGRWNKLTMAHGCYWKQCTFCDISLDYIKNYEPVSAAIICDRMEELISQTGETGFHFVDEAAPPALMREVALEILRRNLKVSWWTNIRFEKRFTSDLCRLLKASGCIAVSGGLEVASDRLLELIKKGVTVDQVAQVTDNFSSAGIMVHAYLMYGFPTQTAQETIDSLEMVRQMFELSIIQSGFWHQFAMTAHSPVGMNPDQFMVKSLSPASPAFAHNDLQHEDPTGAQHEIFSEGLRVSLFNYMHGVGFDMPLQEWFDHDVPDTTVEPFHIEMAIQNNPGTPISENSKIVWLHTVPTIEYYAKKKKGQTITKAKLEFHTLTEEQTVVTSEKEGQWLESIFHKLIPTNGEHLTFGKLTQNHKDFGLGDIQLFLRSTTWNELRNRGLLIV